MKKLWSLGLLLAVGCFGDAPADADLSGKSLEDPNFRSERLDAYEAGCRSQISKRLSVDVAIFYNRYHSLAATMFGAPFVDLGPASPHLVMPVYWSNNARGATYGAEVESQWSPSGWWTLDSSYSWYRPVIHGEDLAGYVLGANPAKDPRHQFQIHSRLDLPHRIEFDQSAYTAGRLDIGVPAYTRFDARHLEFSSAGDSVVPTQARRSVYGKITWRF